MFAVILKDYIYSLFVIAHSGNQIIFSLNMTWNHKAKVTAFEF